jgi:chemosensory pili system protein ChpA (sensor histidine kinase/response regulator)
MAETAEQNLHVVAKELAATLAEARSALEAYAEHSGDGALLSKCAACLHEVHGALRLVEVYGAAMLAEEMEQVAHYLVESAQENRNQPESLDALMRAMVQLPAYLERVLSGGRDLALVLLPLLNDLRAVRGNALLSEGTLLLLNLTSDRKPQPLGQQQGEAPRTVAQWARHLRPRFQTGLLGWIREQNPAEHLGMLSAVAERLEQVATCQPVFQLWWVVGAVVEALRDRGLEGTATIKRLLGQADRELKRLYETGEARYADTPPLDLLNNLLYYLARASSAGPRTVAVRASFKLHELMPVSEQVEQERESLSAPSVKLMETVGAAIKEDLSRVKDVLDIFVRKGGIQVEELAVQIEMLRKISDTLGVLGLGGLRSNVQAQIQRLQEIVASRKVPDDRVLVDIAATLISVEDNLDPQLVRLIMPSPGPAGEAEQDAEFLPVQSAVLRECIVNLARVKETIAAVLARQEPSGADQVPQLLRGITAGLLMLGRSRAVTVFEAISRHIDEILAPPRQIARGRLDRLADAIVAIEYYMETLQNGRSDPWYMLDNAESCLKALSDGTDFGPLPEEVGEAAAGDQRAATLLLGEMPAGLEAQRTEVLPRLSGLTAPPAPAPAAAPEPELVTLFIEEAREEIAKINELFPRWDENPLDQDALTRVRRSFHTLKGSGRMVGARQIGEFGWAIETLLNRLISGTLSRTPGMLAMLR